VEDAPSAELLVVDGGDDVRPGEPAVEDGGQAGLGGDGQLAPQDFALDIGRGEIVVVIEPDLADRPDDAAGGERS
jgi:hypothetical protein